MLLTALVFLLLLSVLVLIHELGHFLVARKFNIKVEEFGFGLPPRIWGIKRGETLYSLNWLPIGGFVKLFGEDEAGGGKLSLPVSSSKNKVLGKKAGKLNTEYSIHNTDVGRAFYARSVGQRAAVVVAGVVMNTLLAIVIFYGFMLLSGFKAELPLLTKHTFFMTNEVIKTDVIVSGIEKNSPAATIGIPSYAKVVAVNGKRFNTVTDFTKAVALDKGKEISLTWIDPKSQIAVTKLVTPRANPPKGQGALGVSLYGMSSVTLSYDTPIQKVLSGVIHPLNLLSYNFDVMGKLIASSIKEKDATAISQGVAGPVGIFSLVGTIVQIPDIKERLMQILNLAGILSISLAFFNVLPIPALDGGRLFFILFEGVTGKKMDPNREALAHTIGMVVLLALILLVTFKDIFQFLL